jgi:hypothetical protein
LCNCERSRKTILALRSVASLKSPTAIRRCGSPKPKGDTQDDRVRQLRTAGGLIL